MTLHACYHISKFLWFVKIYLVPFFLHSWLKTTMHEIHSVTHLKSSCKACLVRVQCTTNVLHLAWLSMHLAQRLTSTLSTHICKIYHFLTISITMSFCMPSFGPTWLLSTQTYSFKICPSVIPKCRAQFRVAACIATVAVRLSVACETIRRRESNYKHGLISLICWPNASMTNNETTNQTL